MPKQGAANGENIKKCRQKLGISRDVLSLSVSLLVFFLFCLLPAVVRAGDPKVLYEIAGLELSPDVSGILTNLFPKDCTPIEDPQTDDTFNHFNGYYTFNNGLTISNKYPADNIPYISVSKQFAGDHCLTVKEGYGNLVIATYSIRSLSRITKNASLESYWSPALLHDFTSRNLGEGSAALGNALHIPNGVKSGVSFLDTGVTYRIYPGIWIPIDSDNAVTLSNLKTIGSGVHDGCDAGCSAGPPAAPRPARAACLPCGDTA